MFEKKGDCTKRDVAQIVDIYKAKILTVWVAIVLTADGKFDIEILRFIGKDVFLKPSKNRR